MKPTSDERREVAARLRERERGWRKMGTHVSVMPDMPATQFEDIAALLGFNGGWILNADIFARLADLIDPTCEVVGDNTYTSDYDFRCKTCGEHFSAASTPRYCPGCGRRIDYGDR